MSIVYAPFSLNFLAQRCSRATFCSSFVIIISPYIIIQLLKILSISLDISHNICNLIILLILNKGQIMDTTKWKSIAVRIEDYKLLRGLCKSKFRAPAGMISKLVHEYIEYQAKKNKVKVENYKKQLMNGDANE